MSIKQNANHSASISPLPRMGWAPHFQAQLDRVSDGEVTPARVVGVRKNSFQTSDGNREGLATLAGRLRHEPGGMFPVTGDWVLLTDTVISTVLARQNALSRGAAGARNKQDERAPREQVIAANLDTIFIVCGLDRDFNLRRIERYLTLVYNCGLSPAIILSKADLHPDPESCLAEVEAVAMGVPVHLVSASDDACLASLEPYLAPGRTSALVGSSGVGKSTLVNRLYGRNVQLTRSLSTQLGKGRHTTTTRDLIVMPQGGMVIDNPGIREIAFWDLDSGVQAAFPEIEKFALECRFANCSHRHEPGCRVREAVAEGKIPPDRMENYLKMKRELEYLAQRRRKSASRVEKERWKEVALQVKAIKKRRD